MIDIHSHLLPGVDDGSPSLDVSLAMLDAYIASGFRSIVVTPHLVGPLEPDYQAKVRDAFARVEPHARQRGLALEQGFEVHLNPDLPAYLQRRDPITLGGTNVVLIDLPFTEWPLYADATFFAIQASGSHIVLAHPERYPSIQDKPAKAEELVARGVTLQVTIGSFSGAFGKRAKKSAETLLQRGLVQIVATDAHSAGHRMAAIPAGMKRLSELVGASQVRRLTVEAPASLLNGDALPPPARPRPRIWRPRFTTIGR